MIAIHSLATLAIAVALVLSTWALRAQGLGGDAFNIETKYPNDSAYAQVRLWQVVGAGALFMTIGLSLPISRLIPRIQIATPAWRWLAVATFFISLLIGATVERLLNRNDLT